VLDIEKEFNEPKTDCIITCEEADKEIWEVVEENFPTEVQVEVINGLI